MQRHHGVEHLGDRNPLGLEFFADSPRLRATSLAQIALRRTILKPETRRVARASRSVAMAHESHVSACAQGGPRRQLVSDSGPETQQQSQEPEDRRSGAVTHGQVRLCRGIQAASCASIFTSNA